MCSIDNLTESTASNLASTKTDKLNNLNQEFHFTKNHTKESEKINQKASIFNKHKYICWDKYFYNRENNIHYTKSSPNHRKLLKITKLKDKSKIDTK